MSSVVDFLVEWLHEFSYAGIFFALLLCGLGVPLPEEPVLLAGGYIAYKGITHLGPTILVAMAGILLGDTIAFILGRRYGKTPAFLGFFKRFASLRTLVKARRFMRENGNRTIFTVRFMPGLRMPTYFMAGSLGVPIAVFLFYDFLAALISVPVSVVAAWYFGEQLDQALRVSGGFHRVLLAVLLLLVAFWVYRWFRAKRETKAAHR